MQQAFHIKRSCYFGERVSCRRYGNSTAATGAGMYYVKDKEIEKSPRIPKLIDNLYASMPEIEADRAYLITESYKSTEGEPIIRRRAKAFYHILKNIPITIRPLELIAGSASKAPRGCQVFPEFSYQWLLDEFETVEKRSADPFYISEKTKEVLKEVYPYWKGKTTSELATSYMTPETKLAMEHNVFTPGNYFYNGVGHVTVAYEKVLEKGYEGIKEEAVKALSALKVSDMDYGRRSEFLKAVILSCEAACLYAERYAKLAMEEAASCKDAARKEELLLISRNCSRVPRYGASSFYEACQSFWFVQLLLQVESSGHSISPGRFDQYMYPYYEKDMREGRITAESAQELIDCIWVKLNDLNKVRDAGSAEGFAGYSLFQNLIAGGQSREGMDVTNDLSFMSIEASMHVMLPQPSLSVRVWNKTPHEFLVKAAKLTRTGIGLPAYYNDEVIIPSLVNRGLTLADAREYNIIGCVEPQKAGKTEGWHDAAFFNMLRPLEFAFRNGKDGGVQIGPATGEVEEMTSFEELFEAYRQQMNYMIELLVNADNSIDLAHAERCPLPFLSSMVEDCIGRGKSVQEGGAVYNFTGPQGFGIANMTDSLIAVKKLVFEEKKLTLSEYKKALDSNFGKDLSIERAEETVREVIRELLKQGVKVGEKEVKEVLSLSLSSGMSPKEQKKYDDLLELINELPKYGNDIEEVDLFAREIAYTYTKPLENYKNPRGGSYQAGLYPVSANVPLGAQTGATPDGRLKGSPIADGVSPASGRDTNGPTAAANSVAKLDHFIASNGTLFNQKFHPSALSGVKGLDNFISLIRAYFDQKGSHMQFNVVSRETLMDAQKHPENYKSLVVRVAGYSALFTTLSRSLQDDIIARTEQGFAG
ncbi:glycerol dehydratase, cobalamin-independent, large subunit [Anaerocolumna jejuensis DSM 15929]|uniref:Glycerol dehydratase, cobalamin-independent, large subunit n=2 Tax=Anaerocolumna TaxID=1843210 RepID=A0A1M6ZJ05_9FIRM|nr:glycerol dehydratase, cobalamin-independent, large subunit [Anaerocolumna jejuensis DSM 15929]